MPVQLLLHKGRIDVRRILDGDFDGRKAPFLERFEKFGAVVGEGRSEQKGIDAKSHNGFFERLVKRQAVSKDFASRSKMFGCHWACTLSTQTTSHFAVQPVTVSAD